MKQRDTENNQCLSTETIIEQALDDITRLVNAGDAWPTGHGSYVPEYLLLVMAAQSDRGRLALDLLDSRDTTEYKEEVKRLNDLYTNGYEHFLEILIRDSNDIETLYHKEQGLGLRLTALEDQLARVYRIVEDGILFNNAEWLQEDLYVAGEEFLQIFVDMFRMIQGAPSDLGLIPSFTPWCSRFEQLEKKFKSKFSFFSSFIDLFQHLKQQEYNQQELWWLHTHPGEEPYIGQTISDEQLQALGKFYLPQTITRSANNCPNQELVIAYALDDTIGEENQQLIEEHVKECKTCLMILLDIRAADARADQILAEQGAAVNQWAAALKKIPAWMLHSEQRDETAIEIPADIPEIQSKEILPDFAAAALAARPAAASLPLMQDSGEQNVTIARIVTVAAEHMVSLYFIQLHLDVSVFEEGKLYIVGRLEELNPKAESICHCDWIDPDGNITLPEELKITDTGLTVIFPFQGLTEKPSGELRVLIIEQQE